MLPMTVRRAPNSVSGPNIFFKAPICFLMRVHWRASDLMSLSSSSRSLTQFVMLGANLDLLQLMQAAQTQVQNSLCLHLGQFKCCHQFGFRIILEADNADNFINIQIDNEVAIQAPLGGSKLSQGDNGNGVRGHLVDGSSRPEEPL